MASIRLQTAATLLLTAAIVACEGNDKETPAPTIYFSGQGNYEIQYYDTLHLSPKITYDRNSTYLWTANGEPLSDQLEITFRPDGMKDYTLNFSVENANGSDSRDVFVSVVYTLDFDTLNHFDPPTTKSLIMAPPAEAGEFAIGNILMNNAVDADTTQWTGFAFSNRTVMTNAIDSAAIGCAYMSATSNTANNYMVISGNGNLITFDRSYTIKSIDVANDNFVYLVSRYGFSSDDLSFVIPIVATNDYLLLRLEGLGENGGTLWTQEHYLVDCRYDNPAKYIRQTTWETINLASLGNVRGLRLALETNITNFPLLACIDNIKLQD